MSLGEMMRIQYLRAMDPRLKPAGMTIFLTFVVYYKQTVYYAG